VLIVGITIMSSVLDTSVNDSGAIYGIPLWMFMLAAVYAGMFFARSKRRK